jgi:hypothetical protein
MVFNTTFQQYFTYILAVSFIGGGNRNTHRKPPTCRVTDKLYLRNNSRMPGSMLILTWVGIIFVKISIEPGIRELFRF